MTTSPSTPPPGAPGPGVAYADNHTITPMQRRVLAGGSIGQFIEFYEFGLYALSAVTLAKVFFPATSELAGLLALFATYGVAFFIRPIGGLFFGALGDRYGRRNILFVTLLTMGLATAGIGVIPPHAVIGVWAPIILTLLRLVQGFATAGESVGAPSFVFEHAPVHRRGFYLNITIAATALPSVFASTLIIVLSSAMSAQDFLSWGWRVPFLLALPMSLVGLWIRARTAESPVYAEMEAEQAAAHEQSTPVRDAFRHNRLKMVQVVFVMGMTAMGFYFLSGYFPSYAQTTGHLSRVQSLMLTAVALTVYTVAIVISGRIGDRVGRRPMMIAGAITMAVAAVPCFMLVTSGNTLLALLGEVVWALAICVYGGGCYTFFVEVFDTKNRFTSAAFSYNLAYTVFGGTAPFIGTAMVNATGVAYAPAFYVIGILVVAFVVLFATRLPETRGSLT